MIKKLLFIAGFLFFVLAFSDGNVFAREIDESYCTGSATYCGSDITACGGDTRPTNACCVNPGGCASSCGTIGQWDYCYADCCTVTFLSDFGYCTYNWAWQFNDCSAADRCSAADSFYLYAGICDTNGCTTGGQYKTCCNGSTPVHSDCPGSASCGGGSSTVICGVSSCSGIPGNCTTLPCGASACEAIFPPGGPTNTPVPGQPTPTTYNPPPPGSSAMWLFSNKTPL